MFFRYADTKTECHRPLRNREVWLEERNKINLKKPTLKKTADPLLLSELPKGIVNNEILWEIPICSNFSIDNGIGALEDADENAKNIAGKNFL